MPASSLAYLGDAVYEIMVREFLVTNNVKTPSVASLEYVKATAQSTAMDKILPLLTERETDIYRRGRNSIHNTPPKSCTPSEYRKATGFEALFGYLWLMGETERIKELCAVGVGIGIGGREIKVQTEIRGDIEI